MIVIPNDFIFQQGLPVIVPCSSMFYLCSFSKGFPLRTAGHYRHNSVYQPGSCARHRRTYDSVGNTKHAGWGIWKSWEKEGEHLSLPCWCWFTWCENWELWWGSTVFYGKFQRLLFKTHQLRINPLRLELSHGNELAVEVGNRRPIDLDLSKYFCKMAFRSCLDHAGLTTRRASSTHLLLDFPLDLGIPNIWQFDGLLIKHPIAQRDLKRHPQKELPLAWNEIKNLWEVNKLQCQPFLVFLLNVIFAFLC